jgi:hypothetical protein
MAETIAVIAWGAVAVLHAAILFAHRRKCATCGHRHWHHVDSPETRSGHGHCTHRECLDRHVSQGACMEFKPGTKGE